MTLAEPFWLILVIPLALAMWLWKPPSRTMGGLRLAALAAVLLAICGLGIRLPVQSGTVVVVADQSLSMPPGSAAIQRETANLIHSAMGPADRIGVVSFAETAAVEQSPQAGKFGDFSAEVGREASNLADALDLALSLIDKERPGRILVVSDGQWTGRDPSAAVARAAAAGVAIDYRALERSTAGDLAIERIQGPESVLPGESFMITAWVQSPVAESVSYELLKGGQVIARGSQSLVAGTNRLLFRDTAGRQGCGEYSLRVRREGTDPVPGNNTARLLVGVRGARPILCVASRRASGLPALLSKGGLDVESRSAEECVWTLEALGGYSAVVLENVPAKSLGQTGMQNLAAWVTQGGGGLMIAGGRDSYGLGGYCKSPLDPVMPLSMELRREHRKLSLAIVVALDRSGSMAVPVPGGKVKMDLADLATAEVLEMLGPTDQFGCIAVDSIPHEIVPLVEVTDKGPMRSKILRIDSQGGGIFIYEALVAAAKMISSATAGTKHIILFADASDSEEPGDYKSLVAKCAAAGITISVVGLGTEKDCDAELLKDIARRGGGQCLFAQDPHELPRLFAQDTLVIARSAFLEEPVGVRPTAGLLSLTRQPLGDFPQIGGYNLCYARPGVNLAVVSEDEYAAPVVAAWQAGLGRTLCYTGEADGKYTGAMAGWKSAGDFFTSLAHWSAGKSQGLGSGIVATQELRNGVCRVELHLDPDRPSSLFSRLPELTTLSARPGEAAASRKTRMQWSSADRLLAEIPLGSSETVLNTIEAAGSGQVTLAPMCLSYSPEYSPQRPGRAAALERIARATGGCERLNLADIWNDIPKKPQWISLAPYLLIAAVVIFLFEVIERRTSLLSIRWKPLRLPRAAGRALKRVLPARKGRGKPAVDAPPTRSPESAHTTPAESPAVAEKVEGQEMYDALAQARQRAGKRTGRT